MADINLNSECYSTTYKLNNNSKITILNNVLSEADANSMFNYLNENISWNSTLKTDSIKPKRDTYWWSPGDYSYSGVHHSKNTNSDPAIIKLLSIVNSIDDDEYDSILFNRYNDGMGIPPHRDDETSLDPNHGIMGIRLGDR